MDNAVYLILVVLFFFGMVMFIDGQRSGAGVWEDYYAKEIVKVVNLAEPGDEIVLNVHSGTKIAKDNNVVSFSEIFEFDNSQNRVCVKLSTARKTCYSYFNDVDIVDWDLELASGTDLETNVLKFKVVEDRDGS